MRVNNILKRGKEIFGKCMLLCSYYFVASLIIQIINNKYTVQNLLIKTCLEFKKIYNCLLNVFNNSYTNLKSKYELFDRKTFS